MDTRPFEVITFDCYGTLIDWEGGISRAFLQEAAENGVVLTADAVLAGYVGIEHAVEAGAYQPYRDTLTETARRVAAALGWQITRERARFLAESLAQWTPFPDTNPALERLAGAGYTLGILSNVDDELLAATRRHLTVPFDLIVTAEQVRSYKPAPGHFEEARRRIDGRPWLHAAQSYFHDIEPASALGIPTAWINRGGQTADGAARPDREFSTLRELAEWLA